MAGSMVRPNVLGRGVEARSGARGTGAGEFAYSLLGDFTWLILAGRGPVPARVRLVA